MTGLVLLDTHYYRVFAVLQPPPPYFDGDSVLDINSIELALTTMAMASVSEDY